MSKRYEHGAEPVSAGDADEDAMEWYCEAIAVGIASAPCSPSNQIHKYPCGWMPRD